MRLNSFHIINTLPLEGGNAMKKVHTSKLINFLEKLLNVIFDLLDLPGVRALALGKHSRFGEK